MKKFLVGLVTAGLALAACGVGLADEATYVASKSSDKYHLATCGTAAKIDAANKAVFKTPEEAQKAGYRPCKICNPPTKTVAFVGSKGSDKYHMPGCKTAAKISRDNLVTFSGKDEAAKAGYTPCQLCCKESK